MFIYSVILLDDILMAVSFQDERDDLQRLWVSSNCAKVVLYFFSKIQTEEMLRHAVFKIKASLAIFNVTIKLF